VSTPESKEKAVGGHAVMAVCYDDSIREVLFATRGADWALIGYFRIP
jgi:hypothetical protein